MFESYPCRLLVRQGIIKVVNHIRGQIDTTLLLILEQLS